MVDLRVWGQVCLESLNPDPLPKMLVLWAQGNIQGLFTFFNFIKFYTWFLFSYISFPFSIRSLKSMPGGQGSRGTNSSSGSQRRSLLFKLTLWGKIPSFRAKFKKSYGHNNYVCNLRPLSIKSPQSWISHSSNSLSYSKGEKNKKMIMYRPSYKLLGHWWYL